MKSTSKKITFNLLMTVCFLLTHNFLFSQTKEDVITTYNKGAELANSNPKEAVKILLQAAEIAEKVGEEAKDISDLCSRQIPTIQYNYAISLYKDKKLDEAIENLIITSELSKKFNDEGTKTNVENLLPKLYNVKGNAFYKDGQYNEAIEIFSKAIEVNPTSASSYLGKALAFDKLNNEAEMKIAIDLAIANGDKTNDTKTVERAVKFIHDSKLFTANEAFKKEKFAEAINFLNQANSYKDDNKEVYYLFALCYNKLSSWDKAVEAADKGLSLENNDPTGKARFFYEKGTALAGKGQNNEACKAFKEAKYGSFKESAEYQITTVLKCN